jgi:hypothetical protein
MLVDNVRAGGHRGAAQLQVRHGRKDLGPNRRPPQEMERTVVDSQTYAYNGHQFAALTWEHKPWVRLTR